MIFYHIVVSLTIPWTVKYWCFSSGIFCVGHKKHQHLRLADYLSCIGMQLLPPESFFCVRHNKKNPHLRLAVYTAVRTCSIFCVRHKKHYMCGLAVDCISLFIFCVRHKISTRAD
jgi:hypothetical protein